MKITTFNPSASGVGSAYLRSLRGVSSTTQVRLLAPVTAPMTGEVRPQAVIAQPDHFVDGVKSGVRVRSWSPPV